MSESIPCDHCDNPAELRSLGHRPVGCGGAPFFRCYRCWQDWYEDVAELLHEEGSFDCEECGREFFSIESFSDYREF